MSIEDTVVARISELIQEGRQLSIGNEYGQVQGDPHLHKCKGWLAAAVNIVQLIVPSEQSFYRKSCEKIASAEMGYAVHQSVGEVTTILENLLKDAEAGLIVSVADQARAEVFDDFLDHGKAYLAAGFKNEAGVIAGVVFEDSIRRVCRKIGLVERGKTLDSLISALVNKSILTATKAKRARASADVRTKATHAQWDEFDKPDVENTIVFTEEFIASHVE